METVLLTGASTGLGLALSKFLLETDYHLILTARESSMARFAEEGIEESDRVWLRTLDVTKDEERRARIDEANAKLGGVDILVNNAGVAYRSVVEHVTEADRIAQMEINFRAPMEMVRLTLPSMREKRRGRIINVSSVGGMMAMPTMAVYSASKFALEGATEALYYEVKPWNIKVSLVEPGFIHSSSFQRVRYTNLSDHSQHDEADPYHNHYIHMDPFIERRMALSVATPDRVARKIIKTMKRKRPPLRVRATMDAHVFDLLRRFMPRRLYHWILYNSLPHIRSWGPNK